MDVINYRKNDLKHFEYIIKNGKKINTLFEYDLYVLN